MGGHGCNLRHVDGGALRRVPLPVVGNLAHDNDVQIVVLKARGRVKRAADVQALEEGREKAVGMEAREGEGRERGVKERNCISMALPKTIARGHARRGAYHMKGVARAWLKDAAHSVTHQVGLALQKLCVLQRVQKKQIEAARVESVVEKN